MWNAKNDTIATSKQLKPFKACKTTQFVEQTKIFIHRNALFENFVLSKSFA